MQLPANMDFALYFNIAFLGMIGLGMLFGFLRGLKKSLFSFIVVLGLYAIFFLTLNLAVNFLWTVNSPYIGQGLGMILPDLSSATSLSTALPMALQAFVPQEFQVVLTSIQLNVFLTGLALFVLKIVWLIFYFTIFNLIYRLLFLLIRVIFFPTRKNTDKYASKNRGMGALFGLMNGVVSVFVSLIIFSGLVSIAGSLVSFVPTDNPETVEVDFPRQEIYQASHSIIMETAATVQIPQEVLDMIELINQMVTAYDENIVVSTASQITITDPNTSAQLELSLYLFDTVLSLEYDDENIAIRNELQVISSVLAQVMDSPFMDSYNLADLSGDDVRLAFDTISDSKLLTSLIPIGLEAGILYMSSSEDPQIVDQLNSSDWQSELYKIDWSSEISTLGEVGGVAFDILNEIGYFNDNFDLETVSIDGDNARNIFTILSESDLITTSVALFAQTAIELGGAEISAVVQIPADIIWADELNAFGEIIGAVLDTGISFDTFSSGDPFEIISALATLDFTVILDSKLITTALINVFEGALNLEELNMITIPDGIQWLDELDGDGNIISNGELRNILLAVNALGGVASTIDFNNLSISSISGLTEEAINSLFESKILVATISDYLLNQDLGFALVIPDSVFDEDGYLLKTELQALSASLSLVTQNLLCDEGDTVCEEDGFGFDIAKAFDLSSEQIDTLVGSDILAATVGDMIITMGGDALVIPDSAILGIEVKGEPLNVITKTEISKMIQAVTVLGISDFANINIDPSILQELGLVSDPTTLDPDKAEKLFASDILHATLSDVILGFAVGDEAILLVPYVDQDGVAVRYTVGSIELISRDELEAVLQAILSLDIQDFNNIDSLDLSLVTENSEALLASAILHATISDQLFALEGDLVSIPYVDEDGGDIRITVGESGYVTEYIAKAELQAAFDALGVLNITDITTFDGNVDLSILSVGENLQTLLSSAILHATISKQVLDLTVGDTPILSVPFVASNGSTEIRKTVGPEGNVTEYIAKDEINAIIDALNVLGITDVTAFDGNVDLSVLSVEGNLDILLASSIIHATVSQQIFDLSDDGFVNVPYVEEDGITNVRVTVGPEGQETEYITKSEISAVFDALDVLGISDVTTFDGNVDLSLLSVEGNIDILLSSAIIQSTISDQIFDLDTAGTLTVPYLAEDGVTELRVTVGPDGFKTNYLIKSEISAIIDGLNVLGITDVTAFSGSVDLSLLAIPGNSDILLSSSTIQATVSKQVFDLGTAGTLTVPYMADDDTTAIRVTVGISPNDTEYIIKSELSAMIDALNILGITDVEAFDGSVDLSVITEGDNADTLLLSSVIQATVSKQIFDLGVDGTLEVPTYQEDGVTLIQVVTGPSGLETTYLIKSELKSIFDALDILGLTDLETFSGTVDLNTLAEGTNAETVLASAVIQATVSKQVLDLDSSDTINVPFFADDNSTEIRFTVGLLTEATDYVLASELVAMIHAMDLLGITDVETFDGTVDITSFYDETNRNILLSSSIMQATISKQLLDLGDATLTVPYTDSLLVDVRLMTGPFGDETEYVSKAEISSIFESLEILGVTDITTFSGDIDLTSFYIQENRDILLGSASMHATISKQLTDLGNATLTVPYMASDNTTEIRVLVGPLGNETEFVVKTEIDAIFESLEILGITDITTFDGDIDLTSFYVQENRDILLASASMHATISKQLFDLGPATLTIPYTASDNVTLIRVTVGEAGEETDYVIKTEIDAMFESLEILGITDITSFDGNIDLSDFYEQANRDILLASASMHATISKQLLDLGDAVLLVPLQDQDAFDVRITVGGVGYTTEYVVKGEIDAMFEALELLEITDINSFDGNVDLALIYGDANQNILLASASMHATITKQLDDLGSGVLLIPLTDVDGISIQATVSGTHYIFKSEIKAIIDSLELLGIVDITTFDGTVSLVNLFDDGNQNTLLSSASMHATITKQLDDLGSGVLLIPDTDVLNVSIQGIVFATHFIYKDEIKAIINALHVLNITDITTFDGTVSLTNLFNEANQDILLTSASMHATITKQLDDLGSGVLLIPSTDVNNISIQATVSLTHFIYKDEIKAIINALEILNITDITTFDGTVSLLNLFDNGNQNILLTSASMHATISKQLDDLGSSVLLIPHTDYDGTVVEGTVSLTHFIYKDEIKAIINALEVFGINDITSFDGSFDISSLVLTTDQDTVLLSASMHATISKTMLDLDDAVLIVPLYTQAGVAEINRIQKTVSSTDFITKAEIRALIDAFLIMGYTDLNTFGASIDSTLFFDNPDTLLLSSSIQATLSDKLLNDTLGNLIIPNTNYATDYTIRIELSDVTYIELVEIKAILTSLELLGLTDFSAISINPANVFAADYDILLASYSMQATVSDTLLSGALDDLAAAGCGSLIVPNHFRETLNVGAGTNEQIEKTELKALLTSLETLGVSDFSGAVDASVVTSLTDAQLDILLASGSMQVTVDNMLKGNANINSSIPDLAVEDVFGMTGITTVTEIKAFIKAANTVGGSNISNVDFDLAVIAALTPAEQDTVLSSMIVRNMITSDVETAVAAKNIAIFPLPPYIIDNTDYEESNPTLFLTKQGALDAITFINS